MSYLETPGASIYHEVVGEGPPLLCISGANGSCEPWRGFAQCLKDRFTVIMYDRRGFSRSQLKGRQEYDRRLEVDSDDAAALIKHISPAGTAAVIGNSSGAIVALKLLAGHPDVIQTLISYEPPLASVLPDMDALWQQHETTYTTYRRFGIPPALEHFAKLTQADQKPILAMLESRDNPFLFSNMQHWFEREFMFYPKAEFDVQNELGPHKGKLVLANGVLSPKGAYQYRGNVELGKLLGLKVVDVPGEHVGYATHASEFSERVAEILNARS
ncbi:uncharacterized protein HMPREF1541_03830 [Cyphellophora europaea CBS 101466]|uniref:AB hydrolase-1 domain-containing protein n=1 Tax=Cyphellophora europaea (strain CBS 101466) TaxID=1220924 RepID=W2RZJ6_CYPE1|nr:uncharacterized protein HMPREF1541_03830 [Cyphellophora europaea CBS 101466]ETN41891.1 hypothetical protein HMPREF1541_03830 [Cyphellophora europaea CBS 101466]